MATKKMCGWWALTLMVALAVGCGDGGGSSSSGGPSVAQKAQAQQAASASSGIERTQDAANDAIVESGAPGSTTAKTGGSAKSAPATTTGTTINYQASVTLTVDLDALNGSGQDAFPNATGKFTVSATGTIAGDGAAGQATYAVHVAWITDGVFTDPVSGASATIASGSNWNYSLVIQWSKTDDLNWSIQATADVNAALNATVKHDSKTWTVTGTVARHASLSFSRTAGNYAWTFSIHGTRTVVVTDGTETHTVISTMTALDHIVIEIDGVAFGPYTLAQIRWWFGYDGNG